MPLTRNQLGSASNGKAKRTLGSINNIQPDVSSETRLVKKEPPRKCTTPCAAKKKQRFSSDENEISENKQSLSADENIGPEKDKCLTANEDEIQNGCETHFKLVCRDLETSAIATGISACLKEDRSGSMYISGAPGTGKTAVVRHVCSELLPSNCRSFYVNCMRLDEPKALAQSIMHELHKGSKMTKECDLEQVERFLSRQKPAKPIVLVLDEMDALAHLHQETLYRLFDWPARLTCRLVLICIANSLDLTDRLLPRLKGRAWRPTLLHFKPYSHDQLARIVESRMASPNPNVASSPIDASAVQLCARKVAASSGDARAALDICRRSVELAGASPSSPAGLGHVSRALRDAAGKAPVELPLQQKLCLAAALLLDRREFTLGALLDRYAVLCRERHLPEVDAAEFAGVCQLLEARGLLHVRRAKETRLHKLSLKLDELSVRRTIDDPALMASVLPARDRQAKGGWRGVADS